MKSKWIIYLGFFYLCLGLSVWIPALWNREIYPVLIHRYFLINAFIPCLLTGFITPLIEKRGELLLLLLFQALFIPLGLLVPMGDSLNLVLVISLLQSVSLFIVYARWGENNQELTLAGFILWGISSLLCLIFDFESYKNIHYEGALSLVLFSCLPPVKFKRTWMMPLLISFFALSFLLPLTEASYLRLAVMGRFLLALIFNPSFYRDQKSLWLAQVLIGLSFMLKATWIDGAIHASHALFINGVVLIFVLNTLPDVVQKLKKVRWIIFLIVLSSATRVSAYLLPPQYFSHLTYSSVLILFAIIFMFILIWRASVKPALHKV